MPVSVYISYVHSSNIVIDLWNIFSRFDHNTSKNDFLSFQNIYSSMLLFNFVWIKRFIWRIDEQGKPSVDAMNIDQNFPDNGQISLMNAWLPLSPFSPRSPESKKKLQWNSLTEKNAQQGSNCK